MTLKFPINSKDHVQGSSRATITLVEYGDYECPYCGQAYPVVKQLQKHYGDQLRFVFRNFPLSEMHPNAESAAEAAEFAATQGLFWEMHDLIYENQRFLSVPFLLKLGKELQLDSADLEEAIAEKAYETKIHEDFLSGVKSGVNGTPTFFINNQRHNGNFDLESLMAAIESSLVP